MNLSLPRSRILTHRGLEPDKHGFWPESSYESFADHISRGFGIEFDLNFCRDGIAVSHDSTLERITGGRDKRTFSSLSVREVQKIRYGTKQGCIATLDQVMELIAGSTSKINAMHLKARYQFPEFMEQLVQALRTYKTILDRFFIFDLKPHTARFMKEKITALQLAPSVAHPYDIKRYNGLVGGTLLSVERALECRDMYNWVWLDEWNLADVNGGSKKLYTAKTFDTLRSAGYKIGLVTPEMHTSAEPGILGGPDHEDGINPERFLKRMQEIISLKPDVICTDHPESFAE